MRRYTYTDRSFGPKARPTANTVIFECEAPDILAADELLLKATGHVAAKDATIWCSFVEAPTAL
jgi:hypothetical protein